MLGRAELTSVATGYVASADGPAARTFAPRLGEHTRQILAEHGLPEAEIEALHAAGVVRSPTPPDAAPEGPPAPGREPRGAAAAAVSAAVGD